MDIEVGGHSYRSRKLPVRQQLHIARRLSNTSMQFLLTQEVENNIPSAVQQTAEESGMNPDEIRTWIPNLMPMLSLRALGQMTEADADFVINTCLSVLQRQSGHNGAQVWTHVINPQNGAMQFQDIDLKEMLELTVHVLRENLGDFFGESRSASQGQSETPRPLIG
jgi:hypothetical protein